MINACQTINQTKFGGDACSVPPVLASITPQFSFFTDLGLYSLINALPFYPDVDSDVCHPLLEAVHLPTVPPPSTLTPYLTFFADPPGQDVTTVAAGDVTCRWIHGRAEAPAMRSTTGDVFDGKHGYHEVIGGPGPDHYVMVQRKGPVNCFSSSTTLSKFFTGELTMDANLVCTRKSENKCEKVATPPGCKTKIDVQGIYLGTVIVQTSTLVRISLSLSLSIHICI